jgi:ClpP class serine protease
MEALVDELKKAKVERAYLLVNSPGGTMTSTYKIARALRTTCKRITTFVPHVAASGGTLLALTGNEIVMGLMSHITPLDVQVSYKGTIISAATFMRFFARASEWFETKTPDESPYPRKALADKLDP